MKFKARNYPSQSKLAKYKPLPGDTIILIVGRLGVGKSTFINYLAGEEVVRVGHDAESCTTEFEPVVVNPPPSILLRGRRLVFVDTPGFDENFDNVKNLKYAEVDLYVLKCIASWLAQVDDIKLSGAIYLHDISLSRIKGIVMRNFDAFTKFCDAHALRNIVLCTTKWTELESRSVGEARQNQLCDLWWKGAIENGSIVRSFEDTHKSAWEIVDSVLACDVIDSGVTDVAESLFVDTRSEVTVEENLHSCTPEVQHHDSSLPSHSASSTTLQPLLSLSGIFAGVTILTATYSNLQNVKSFQQQCKEMYERMNLMATLPEVSDGWEGNTILKVADEIEAVIRRIDTKLKEWASRSHLESFLQQGEIKDEIDGLHRDINTAIMKLNVSINMKLARGPMELQAIQDLDEEEIRELLHSIVASTDDMKSLDIQSLRPYEEITESPQTESIDPHLQPRQEQSFREGLWPLRGSRIRASSLNSYTGTVASDETRRPIFLNLF